MIHISLFSGIGGFELAAEWMGWRNWVSCDINEFGNKVREYYWPDGYCHKDVKTLTYEKINSELSDRFGSGWRDDDIIITGGFPCQPYSAAGKRLGKEDERHLWPEMLRVISEVKPTYIVGENVRGLTNWNGGVVFEEVCADLENLGYEVQPVLLPACAIGAPHRRDRIWFVAMRCNAANTECVRLEHGDKTRNLSSKKAEARRQRSKSTNEFETNGDGDAADTLHKGLQGGQKIDKWQKHNAERRGNGINLGTDGKNINRKFPSNFQNFPTQSPICGGDDGLPTRLDNITFSKWRKESIKAYGNAIVPQVAYQIFKAICPSKSNSETFSNDSQTIDSSPTSPSPMNSGWNSLNEQ